jgi:hypothetical protein
MYKLPAKFNKSISTSLKNFLPLIKNLQAKGKSSSEDDARIILNDLLHDVLGYDKYNELRTEMRERNGRLDYAVKLIEGPFAKKRDRIDFVIEAKAAHVNLNQNHIDQTLSYCLAQGVDYFVLTNTVKWELYAVSHSKRNPSAKLIHEVNFGVQNDIESLTYDFYLLSKHAYLSNDWRYVKEHAKATKVEDVVAVLLSDKVIRLVGRELSNISGLKIQNDVVKEIIENQIIKSEVEDVNKKLLKKMNSPSKKTKSKSMKNHDSSCSTSSQEPKQFESEDSNNESVA